MIAIQPRTVDAWVLEEPRREEYVLVHGVYRYSSFYTTLSEGPMITGSTVRAIEHVRL
jgi:hypothetical protein